MITIAKLEKSIEALKQYASMLGYWPSISQWDEYAKEHGYMIFQTMRYHHEKSWEQLRKEFGFPKKQKRYTKEQCVEALRKAAEIYGPTISRKEYERWAREQEDVPSSVQISIVFGSYTQAKIEAGLVPNAVIGKTFSNEDIIQALQNCAKVKGKLFSETEYEEWRKGRKDIPHVETIRRRFGSVVEARKALGLEYYESGKNIFAWKDEDWKAYFFQFINHALSIDQYEKWAKENEAPSISALRRHAGGYRAALRQLLPIYLEELKKGENEQ